MTRTVRPATPDDVTGLCELLNAVDMAEIGRPETDPHTVESDLRRPGVDLARDSWIAADGDGRFLAYGLLWDVAHGERIDIDLYTLPSAGAAPRRLLELMEARAAQKAAENGASRAVVQLYLNSSPTLDTAMLAARGWQVIRRFNVLTRPVSAAQDPVPGPLPGVTLRACRTEADRRRVHELLDAAFTDHFEYHARPYDQWLESLDADRTDWSLVWIAYLAGLGDAGVLMARNDDTSMGWIRHLGVLEAARGRGIGSHLLRHAFGALAARGRDTVGLGVDTQNTSEALRLYLRHGMTLHYAVHTWQVELPVRATAP
ncbi:GNAT family N-acetyltransferase [Streptomyces chiangmaiensis]|uniref:GNAT family N-acetyltransferase n=1 Tax=Streptomyces chiangmaiensis TaxID=766497 RepID=A0ABU7FGT4_9ACTN|nr:GNAT family N-acetyltransferase [Streptomyces chiangmaiensis]MED7823304.1 GNAT family N-acetyltransferase [Streptomyces chiangmaiensis]